MDEADLKYLLKQQNLHLQAQGFSALISAINTQRDAKKKKSLHALLLECLQSEASPNLSTWAAEAILASSTSSSSEPSAHQVLLDEVLASVRSPPDAKANNLHTIVHLLFQMVNGRNGEVGLVTRLVRILPEEETHLLLVHLKHMPAKKCVPLACKLMHSNHLSTAFKLGLLNQLLECSNQDFKCIENLLESIATCFLVPHAYLLLPRLTEYPAIASNLLSSGLANNPDYLVLLLKEGDLKGSMFEVSQLVSGGNLDLAQTVLELDPENNKLEHPIYLPCLLSLYSLVQEMSKFNLLRADFPVEVLKRGLQACQKAFKTTAKQGGLVEEQEAQVDTLTHYFAWIVQDKCSCLNYVKYWCQNYQASDQPKALYTCLAFAAGLYACLECEDLLGVLQVCSKLAKAPLLQNQILLLFFSFFSHGDLEKKQMILKNLPNIATNQVVTRQILKFLFAFSKTTSKQLAFEVVGELWSKYNWILNEAEMEQHFVHLDSKSDDEEALQLKMVLIRRICKIQQGERFVPQLLNLLLLQPNHTEVLTAQAILALTDLCGQSLLKVDKVRAKVEPVLKEAMKGDVKWPKMVAAYCQLLATSSVDLEDYNIALLYVEELWQLKDSLSQEVCAAAWNALAQFPLCTLNAANLGCSVPSSASALIDLSQVKIEEGISSKLTGTQLLGIARAIHSDETYKAFGNFLHKVISCEIEELPRNPFYTDVKQESEASSEENSPNSPILFLDNLMPVLRETLENGGTAALDMAAYALAEPITKHLQPNTKKMAKCTHLLSYALLKARADSNLEFSNTLNYFASWKSGMEYSFRLFHDTRKKTNAHFTVAMARDMFMDLMQKAMDQVKDAAVNVVCCLPFLWSTMNDMLAECTAESADLHWQISVVEYLLLLAIEDYQPKSLPIFQKETMRTCQLSAAAFLSLALILQRHNLDFYSHAHLPELILKNISSSCPSWMVGLIKGLLLPLHQLPALSTPRPQLQPSLSNVKLEPLEEGDHLEPQRTMPSPPSTKAALSRVFSCLANNEPMDNQEVDLLDVCEGRHNLKVLANILNVDPTFVANLLNELPCPHGLQDRFKKVAKESNLAEVANLKTAFQLFSELAEADHIRFGNQFAKRIEKTISAFSAMTAANQRSGLAFSKNKNPVAECASCCLGEFYVGNLPGRLGRVAVKKNYKELPEGSVLKEVLNELRSDCKSSQKEVLLQSLLNQLRSDTKSLPPMDWSVLYSPGETSSFYTRLFQLAVEQRNAKLLAKVLSAKHLDFKADLELLCSVISPKLKCLLELLPSSSMTSLLDSLLVAISQANYPAPVMGLIHQLVANMANPLVLAAIWRHAPPLHTNYDASLLMHPFYLHFADCFDASTCPSEFKSSLDSHIVQAWLEAKKRSKMNVQKIVTIFAKISSEQQSSSEVIDNITATSLLILAQCSTQLSSKERIAFLAQLVPMLKILKVSFHSKNSLRDHKSLQVYFDLLVAFVVSSPSLTGLPFFFLDSSKSAASTWTIATHRFPVLFREFATQLLAADKGSDAFKEVVIYLVELYPGLPEEQGKAVKACLRSCVNFAPQMSVEAIEAAGIWEELFL